MAPLKAVKLVVLMVEHSAWKWGLKWVVVSDVWKVEKWVAWLVEMLVVD